MKLNKNFNPAPEKGVLFILRIGTLLQIALVVIFLLNAAFFTHTIGAELSPTITLAICLILVSILVFHPEAPRFWPRAYLPIIIALQTLISITLPLLFTSQRVQAELISGFWLFIPAIYIPLSIVGLQYRFQTTFIYSLVANFADLTVIWFVNRMTDSEFDTLYSFLVENDLIRSMIMRFVFMVMMGHILSVFVSAIRKNAAELEIANTELEELNQHLEEHVLERTQALETANQKTLEGWVRLMELRHLEPEGHVQRMTDMAKAFGGKLGLSQYQIKLLNNTIRLHDIGKLGLPDRILLQSTPLTDQDYEHSKLHVEYSMQILEGIKFLKPCTNIIVTHHERWNGSGYPKGLHGEEIPYLARIFTVIDVYDVLTHDTAYRKAWTKTQARDHLFENSDILFDRFIVNQFLGLLETQELDNIANHI